MNMNKEDLIDFLSENLKIELCNYYNGCENYGESGIEAILYLGEEKISSSVYILP